MQTGLDGKRALVLGASKGLGFGIAQGLAEEGARVAIASRTMDGSKAAAEKIGRGVLPFVCDTGKVDQVDALVKDVMAALRRRRHPRAQQRRPAARQGAGRVVRSVAPVVRCHVRQSGADRRPASARHDRAQVRPHHLGDLLRRDPADPESGDLERHPPGSRRLGQDAGERGRVLRRDRQRHRAGPHRHGSPEAARRRQCGAHRPFHGGRGGGSARRHSGGPLWRDRGIRGRGRLPRQREGVVHDRRRSCASMAGRSRPRPDA